MICLKISTFVVSTTTVVRACYDSNLLWFAWKYLPLWYQQQLCSVNVMHHCVVICLKISTFVVSTTTDWKSFPNRISLWFAWKYLPLWYQQQLKLLFCCCEVVVICLKISTFVVSTTTRLHDGAAADVLWFAWKYLPLWYQQQHNCCPSSVRTCCDLLENIYLCGINNNGRRYPSLKRAVVICLKISTFVVSTTTNTAQMSEFMTLWFAWKYLPLWYQQQRYCPW